MKELGELITAMVTPFDDKLDVDYTGAARLAERLIENGNDGIVVAGTTGESPTLTKEEKLKMFKTVRDTVGSRGSVIAGTGSYCTRSTVELSKQAQELGVDGLLVVAPYYNKPPQEGLFEHFAQVARAVSIPIILYNIPGRTGINVASDVIEKLHQEFPHIMALKDATGSLDQTSEVAIRTGAVAGLRKRVAVSTAPAAPAGSGPAPAGFRIYSGDDSLTLPMLACGGTGVISVAGHIVGPQIKEMIIHFFEGRVKEAKDIHWRLFPLFKALFATTNPILVKEALRFLGFDPGGLRAPLVRATAEQSDKLKKALQDAGLDPGKALTMCAWRDLQV